MSWIRRETEKETVQYICPHCHDYHEFREDFGERTFRENYIFCRRCGARNGTGNAPTLNPPNEWVSVEERLPTDEHPVLVFVGYADTMTGFITTSSYFCFDENPHWQWDGLVRDEQRTLFWMPLPAPPDSRPPEGEA